jgi:hypothetical protein
MWNGRAFLAKDMRIGTGFVVKADAGRELLSAVRAVILGEEFLSSRCRDHTFEEAMDWAALEGLQ